MASKIEAELLAITNYMDEARFVYAIRGELMIPWVKLTEGERRDWREQCKPLLLEAELPDIPPGFKRWKPNSAFNVAPPPTTASVVETIRRDGRRKSGSPFDLEWGHLEEPGDIVAWRE